MKTIGLVMHVLNESEFLDASLRSIVSCVEQAVVVDQGSTDGSAAIARECGATVMVVDDNFLTKGEKYFRDLAVQLCWCEWLMILDGDEILTDGWRDVVDNFLADAREHYGMILIDYWQMIGSSGFHTPDSPLPNERPFLIRCHGSLFGSESVNGTQCHSSYRATISPKTVGRLPSEAACFHMGYAKADMDARFRRNIERGDYGTDAETIKNTMNRAIDNPLQCLPTCVLRAFDPQRMPESIRTPKWKCEYDPETMRITGRAPA